MSYPIQPGWYQDPTGRVGDARWWDGAGWTEQHLAREMTAGDPQFAHLQTPLSEASGAHTVMSPSTMSQYEVVVPPSNAGNRVVYDAIGHPQSTMTPPIAPPAPPAPPRPDGPADHPWRDPKNRKAIWWGLGGLVSIGLILTLLIVTGVFSANDDDEPGANPTGTYTTSAGPSDPSTLRIIDKDAGISYAYLGEGWKDYTQGIQFEHQNTVGEYIVTQEDVPSGGQFIAQVTSGLLVPSFGSPGPSEYAATLTAVEKSVRGYYYPQPNEVTNLSEGEMTIDGHPAYHRSFDLTWDVAGYDSTGERVVLVLIDSGKTDPVFFYCSFPNTHAELYPLIEQVIASITVDT